MMYKKISLAIYSLFMLALGLSAQADLIQPIPITPPMDSVQAQLFSRNVATIHRNWGIGVMGADSLLFNKYTGKGVTICILDTGVPTHKELEGKIVNQKNFTDDETAEDKAGHATHVGGILSEACPDADHCYGKVLNNEGKGNFDDIAEGLQWCIDIGADIINLSLGSSFPSNAMHDAIKNAVDSGLVVIAAAGNSGYAEGENRILFPGRFKEVLAIGSFNKFKEISTFSSGGIGGYVVAPGDQIFSLWLDDGFRVLSGTSMAAPFMSALVALYLEMHRPNGPLSVVFRKDVIDLEPPGYDPRAFYGIPNIDSVFTKETRKDWDGPPPPPEPDPEPEPVDPDKNNKLAKIIKVVGITAFVILAGLFLHKEFKD